MSGDQILVFGALTSSDPTKPNASLATYNLDGKIAEPDVPHIPIHRNGISNSVLLYASPNLSKDRHILIITSPDSTMYFLDKLIVTKSSSDRGRDNYGKNGKNYNNRQSNPGKSINNPGAKIPSGIVVVITLGAVCLFFSLATATCILLRRRRFSSRFLSSRNQGES